MDEQKKKIDSILKEDFKLPTANQIRKYIKQKQHVWNDLDRMVAPSVILPNDVLILYASEATLLEKFKKKETIEKARELAKRRIEYLDDILVDLKKSSFDYGVATISPPETLDENGVPLIVGAEIRLSSDRKRLLDLIAIIDKEKYNKQ